MTVRRARSSLNSPSNLPHYDMILDSGAYSAWKLKKPIDVKEYTRYAKANADMYSTIVNLDVIGPNDPETAAAASFENLKYMMAQGLDVMPVYHARENKDWLHRMLDLGCRKIGLSASSLVQRNQVDDWYSMAWGELVDSKGLPLVKAHAFGESRFASLAPFPWYSADSASWIIQAEVSGKTVVKMENGRSTTFGVRHDKLHTKSSPDIDSLDENEVVAFNEFIQDTGMTMDFFREPGPIGAMARLWALARIYIETETRVRKLCPIRHTGHGLFNRPKAYAAIAKWPTIHIPDFKFHLVCNINPRTWLPIIKTGHRRLLVSYFYTEQMKSFDFRNFVYNHVDEVIKSKSSGRYWKEFHEFAASKGITI